MKWYLTSNLCLARLMKYLKVSDPLVEKLQIVFLPNNDLVQSSNASVEAF